MSDEVREYLSDFADDNTGLRKRIASLEQELAEARAERQDAENALFAARDDNKHLEAAVTTLRVELEQAFRDGYRAAERRCGGLVDVNAEGEAVAAWSRYQQERKSGG